MRQSIDRAKDGFSPLLVLTPAISGDRSPPTARIDLRARNSEIEVASRTRHSMASTRACRSPPSVRVLRTPSSHLLNEL